MSLLTAFIILLSTSVIIFMTITLNPVSCILLVSISLWPFPEVLCCHFIRNILLHSVCFCVVGKTAAFPSLEEVALCRQWTLSFNLALALGCLSNICDWAAWFSLDSSQLLRVCPDLFRKDRSYSAPSFRLSGIQTFWKQLLNYANICSPVGLHSKPC